MISSQVVKCWSCAEVPNDLPSAAYIIWKDMAMVEICTHHNHYKYPISFHDLVHCLYCDIDNLDPNKLGIHFSHPLIGMNDWNDEKIE